MPETTNTLATWTNRSWQTLDYFAGLALTGTEVKNLERILSDNPDDGTAHLLLAGHYERFVHVKPLKKLKGEEFVKHALWLIDNEPANPNLKYMFVGPSNIGFTKIRTHWHKALLANPESVQTLVNAAHFFQFSSFQTSEKLWKRIVLLETNNQDWHLDFSHLYYTQTLHSKSSVNEKYARKCIEQFKIALDIHAKSPRRSYLEHYLSTEVKSVLDVARKFNRADDIEFFESYLGSIPKKNT